MAFLFGTPAQQKPNTSKILGSNIYIEKKSNSFYIEYLFN